MPESAWFPYEKRYKYPHMMPADVAIWEKYIDKFPMAFERVAYDVAVGEGASFDPTVNDVTGGDINKLYQRKIDVVGQSGRRLHIIELKPAASTAAIGQVRAYVTLFKRDYESDAILVPTVITDLLLPEMQYLATTEGVDLIVV